MTTEGEGERIVKKHETGGEKRRKGWIGEGNKERRICE
jgi:hypothetical protein